MPYGTFPGAPRVAEVSNPAGILGLFDSAAAYDVKLRVFDEFNRPTTAMFVIRDNQGRVYPSQAKRLASSGIEADRGDVSASS